MDADGGEESPDGLLRARPTLRCVAEDLAEGWDAPSDRTAVLNGLRDPTRPFHDLSHPLVRKAVMLFPDEDVEADRETISALPGQVFKVRHGRRWRGAVWVDDASGQPWLIAGGYRRDGDGDDFYTEVTARVRAAGLESILPASDDRARLALEQSAQQLRAWEISLRVDVVEAVAEAVRGGTAKRALRHPDPDGAAPAEIQVDLERLSDEESELHEIPAMVEVHVTISDWSDPDALAIATTVACSAIAPHEDDWDTHYTSSGQVLTTVVTEARLKQLVASAQLAEETGATTAPTGLEPIRFAHYAPTRTIADASVDGRAVRGLCGRYFVPRNDPTDIPVCPACDRLHAVMLTPV